VPPVAPMTPNSSETFSVAEVPNERLDRQVRIPGWNQEALGQARVGVVGDDPWLTGLVVASAVALGINRLTVVAPALDPRLTSAARGLNPELELPFFPGFLSHFLLEDLLKGCNVLIDLSHHALATKLLLTLAHREALPLVRSYDFEEDGAAGVRLFTYQQGREWQELLAILPRTQLPSLHRGDPVLALVAAGLALEEAKKLLMGEPVTPEVVSYAQTAPGSQAKEQRRQDIPIALVGAGALGNFVALGLAALGFTHLTLMDPDPVEVTNLNRQILFWDAVGEPKALALARRITEWFGITPDARTEYVTRKTALSEYAVVFDCTDNFASRIVLSETCRANGQILISGGTGVAAGQVVVYNPAEGGPTPAELLGLYDLVDRRDAEISRRQRASCLYAPEPAIIMTNQIIGGLMVDAFRRLLAGEPAPNTFYDARGEKML
jgi:molybdopterin/thiamine biosynthesis adenylyltransferase